MATEIDDRIAGDVSDGDVREGAVFRKVGLRLIPFLFLLYVVNILDRVNVGFARLSMLGDLGLSEGGLQLRRGHLLHRLHALRGAQQPDPAPDGRPALDQPDHGQLGDRLRRA